MPLRKQHRMASRLNSRKPVTDMKLKVPPVAVFLIAAALLWAGVWLLPELRLILPGRTVPALLLAVAGLLPGLKAVLDFAGKKTTVNPMAPEKATALVTGGTYRFSRNPMYLGLLLLLLALSVYWGTPVALIVVASNQLKNVCRSGKDIDLSGQSSLSTVRPAAAI